METPMNTNKNKCYLPEISIIKKNHQIDLNLLNRTKRNLSIEFGVIPHDNFGINENYNSPKMFPEINNILSCPNKPIKKNTSMQNLTTNSLDSIKVKLYK